MVFSSVFLHNMFLPFVGFSFDFLRLFYFLKESGRFDTSNENVPQGGKVARLEMLDFILIGALPVNKNDPRRGDVVASSVEEMSRL